jgi:hypothetical protein
MSPSRHLSQRQEVDTIYRSDQDGSPVVTGDTAGKLYDCLPPLSPVGDKELQFPPQLWQFIFY